MGCQSSGRLSANHHQDEPHRRAHSYRNQEGTTKMSQKCYLCGKDWDYNPDFGLLNCKSCGKYELSPACTTELSKGTKSLVIQNLKQPDVLSELAVYLHDQNAAGRVPTLEAGFLLAMRPQPVVARLDRMLIRLASERIRPEQQKPAKRAEPWRLGAYDEDDVDGLLRFNEQNQFITKSMATFGDGSNAWQVRLTAAGWARAAELTRATTGRQAFVAMAFSPDMKPYRESAFGPAIRAAGYDPFWVDERDHNGRIDDRIEYEIKNSIFVVADFTHHRGGVYYEAGFAQGLGKPVIWTVRDTDKGDKHFDTRQFNHIEWSEPDELRARLEARILNTVGKGPAA